MNGRQKTCLIALPQSPLGNPAAADSDDLYELIIQPTLAEFGFHLLRADGLGQSGVISSDIVGLLRDADLCVLDLTGGTPSILYALGRRHESGKSSLVLIRRDQPLPIDVPGTLALAYDLSSPRTARDSALALRQQVAQLATTGPRTLDAVVSLGSLAAALARIERRLDGLAQPVIPPVTPPMARPADSIAPRLSISSADAQRTLVGPASFPYPEPRTIQADTPVEVHGHGAAIVAATATAAGTGDEASANQLLQLINDAPETLLEADLLQALEALVEYAAATGRARDLLPHLERKLFLLARSDRVGAEHASGYLYLLGRLYYEAGEFQKARLVCEKAVGAKPMDRAYLHQLSLIHAALGNAEDAAHVVALYVAIADERDPAYLSHAADVYRRAGREDEALAAETRLASLDPSGAESRLGVS